jgi:hypothetical protein
MFLEEHHLETSQRRIARDPRADDSAADDNQIEGALPELQ